ncbi:hypothetical protein [Methyloceanibacter sp.]|uniref:hypothetical protein n=1 Tax=Methyloceanibacter sp. TaxID=1965321 RepID=UPI003D6D49FF
MEVPRQSGLYRLAKRLSLGRLSRYFALWARYLLRRGQSALSMQLQREPPSLIEAQAAALAGADLATAKRMSVASWFPLDRANAGLHRTMFASIAQVRPDLGVTPEILDCLSCLKRTDDLSNCVDAMVERGQPTQIVNTALYILLLKRFPAPSEHAMIVSRHPRHALIAILSGDEYRKQGRRVLAN